MSREIYEKRRSAQRAKAEALLDAGVDFADIERVYIDDEVEVGEGTFIGPDVILEGATKIGKDCRILQNCRFKDAVIGDGVTVESSVILGSTVGGGTSVGPFAYIRPGSNIGEGCKVGDFVEVKNSKIGDGTKSAHLTYIGDADVGRNVNFGCGVVLVNYDGTTKHRSEIGDGAFIGCNTNLVSPVKVGDGAYIAAGSTITDDIPEDALAIARNRQTNIEGWAKERGLYRKK
ncbi:MAG: hypothetical protein ACOYJO_06710 [Eubacterium sp.]|jgi:bifunctional UDP-N-acetylglucosamine pyrophosphorylase/glucosamine-1-phosphate N-acetyltransferase